MRTSVASIVAVVVVAVLPIGRTATVQAQPVRSVQSNVSPDATIQINGLSCPYCVYNVERSLRRVNGVEKVVVDLNTGIANVWFTTGKAAKKEKLRQAVKDSGFTPTKVVINATRSSGAKAESAVSGAKGDRPGEFLHPIGIDVDAAGRFYVADSGNNRIQVFNKDGVFQEVFTEAEFGLAPLRRPTDAAIGRDGTVYVVDFGHNRVQRWKTNQFESK